MPATFKLRREPDLHNFQSDLKRDQPLPEADHIGIVMLAREAGAFDVPANGAADAFDFVGDDGLAVSRST